MRITIRIRTVLVFKRISFASPTLEIMPCTGLTTANGCEGTFLWGSRKRKMVVNMGGSLTPHSVNFIRKLFKKKLLDRVETRNVVIKLSDKVLDNFESLIINAFKFEIDWMKFKEKRLKSKKFKLKNDSSLRIQVLKRRLDSFQNG